MNDGSVPSGLATSAEAPRMAELGQLLLDIAAMGSGAGPKAALVGDIIKSVESLTAELAATPDISEYRSPDLGLTYTVKDEIANVQTRATTGRKWVDIKFPHSDLEFIERLVEVLESLGYLASYSYDSTGVELSFLVTPHRA
jgi:hypothetical protein